MGSKNISIPDAVYEKLREERRSEESFGDTIDRLLGGRPVRDFWGAWSEETTSRANTAIEAGRKGNEERLAELFE